MAKRINRSLYECEIHYCQNYVLTEHAKQRLSERVDFTQLSFRIANSKHGFFDYQGKVHLFLHKENCELIGVLHNTTFIIYTVVVVSVHDFIKRRQMFVDY